VFTDRTALTSRAYNEQSPLAARLAIYDHQRDRVDLPGVAVAALTGVRGTVLDAGCGLGTYARRLHDERPDLHVLPLDLSAGMRPEVVGDVQALPLADGSVDAALAMHMLYHVPDITAAARELRRVVRPGGVLLASTNAADDKAEVGELWASAVGDLTGSRPAARNDDGRFTTDDGDLLAAAGWAVSVESWRREVAVPSVEPVVAFMDSMRGLAESDLPAGVTWDEFLDRVRSRVTDDVERTGAWRMHSHVGVLTCR
jgi:SAM-dependent methyltransferase